MTTITRKTRKVTQEYWEVEYGDGKGLICDTLAEARLHLTNDVYEWFRHAALTTTTADMTARYVLKNWDQLKAIIEGVRVEGAEKPDPAYSLSPEDALILMAKGYHVARDDNTAEMFRLEGNYVFDAHGDGHKSPFWLEHIGRKHRFIVASAPAASPESASAPRT